MGNTQYKMALDYEIRNSIREEERLNRASAGIGDSRLIKSLKSSEEENLKKHLEVREEFIIGGLKHFLNQYMDGIFLGHYLGLNGIAKSIFKNGMDLYNRTLKEGYSLHKHLSEQEMETLFIFLTQANQEYLPYKNKKQKNAQKP